MSEKSPEKEPRKIFLTCGECAEDFFAEAVATRNYIFTKEPKYSVICIQHRTEDCGVWTPVFHDQHKPLLAAISTDYPTSVYETLEDLHNSAPIEAQFILEQRQELESTLEPSTPPTPPEPKQIESRALTPRQEAYIQHWGEFLQQIIVDETDFGVRDEATGA